MALFFSRLLVLFGPRSIVPLFVGACFTLCVLNLPMVNYPWGYPCMCIQILLELDEGFSEVHRGSIPSCQRVSQSLGLDGRHTFALLWLRSKKLMGLKAGLVFPSGSTISVLDTPFTGVGDTCHCREC